MRREVVIPESVLKEKLAWVIASLGAKGKTVEQRELAENPDGVPARYLLTLLAQFDALGIEDVTERALDANYGGIISLVGAVALHLSSHLGMSLGERVGFTETKDILVACLQEIPLTTESNMAAYRLLEAIRNSIQDPNEARLIRRSLNRVVRAKIDAKADI